MARPSAAAVPCAWRSSGAGSLFWETNVCGPRLAIMEYDIRQRDEAYDALRRQYKVYDWTTSGIFIALMLVVALLLLLPD
jgi:hypothetical protein